MLSGFYTRETEERERLRLYRARTQAAPATSAPKQLLWQPLPDRDGLPSPQRLAYESQADILGYGGGAGGGKSDLLLGLAGTHHQQSIIFRREFPRLRNLIDRSRAVYNAGGTAASKDAYNEQLHRWRLRDGRQVHFAAMQYETDKFSYQGRPHDFYGFDEATEFSESQIRFVIGWNRSTAHDPHTQRPQRCRVVLTFNPPMHEDGEWIIGFFLPWFAHLFPALYTHPHPAVPGELRWYATIDGVDEEIAEEHLMWCIQRHGQALPVASGAPVQDAGQWLVPVRGVMRDGQFLACRSRTFIPASLADNPILEATGYGATIDAMPEPYRSLLRGQFGAAVDANPWQVIPTAWVLAAQERGKAQGLPEKPQVVGVDVARGGRDQTVLARWALTGLCPIEAYPGSATPNGPSVCQLLAGDIAEGHAIAVDIIGVGGSVFDTLHGLDIPVTAYNAAEAAPADARDMSGKLAFANVRAWSYWMVREALDPDTGSDLVLPDDPSLRADLCAPRWRLTTRGITIEPKSDLKERLGRSPDKGDAAVIGYWLLKTGMQQWLVW